MPKILAVDDSVTMRRILEMTFIGQDGIQVVTADGGESGLHASGGADLIFVDVSMPGMSGYDFAKAVRGNGIGAPIVVMGSEHHPIDQEKLRASGADDHVMKPFETQAFIDKAKDLLARGGKGVAAPAGRPVAAAPAAVAAPPRPPAPPAAPAAPPRPPAAAAPIPGVVAAPARPAAVAAPVAAVAPASSIPRSATASFGAPAGSKPPSATAMPATSAGPRPPLTAAQPVPLVTKKADPQHDALAGASAEMEGKLQGMGLTPAQIEGVLSLSREVIERVVWEVVPDLAETIIREEIKRLTS